MITRRLHARPEKQATELAGIWDQVQEAIRTTRTTCNVLRSSNIRKTTAVLMARQKFVARTTSLSSLTMFSKLVPSRFLLMMSLSEPLEDGIHWFEAGCEDIKINFSDWQHLQSFLLISRSITSRWAKLNTHAVWRVNGYPFQKRQPWRIPHHSNFSLGLFLKQSPSQPFWWCVIDGRRVLAT
jgi:hypothetical protein